MPRATTLTVLLLAAFTAGCASYSGIHGEERTITPDSLAVDGEAIGDGVFVEGDWPQSNWWSTFGDPKLDALVSRALADNPSLHAAEARVRGARSLAEATRSSLFPRLDVNASASSQRTSENDVIFGPFGGQWINQGRATLDFSYEFDFWGRHRNELRAALGEARAAHADAAAARLVLAAAVAQTYFQLQTDIAAADLARQTLTERESLSTLNRERARRGLEATIPVRQSDEQVASSRVEVSAAETAVQVDRHALAALLGLGPDATLDVQPSLRTYDAPVPLPTNLPANLLARRPDVAAQRFRVEAAAARVGAARADFYPNLNLAAFIGLESETLDGFRVFDQGSRIAGVAPALSLPLFDAGRRRANLQARYDEYDLAVTQYNQTLVDAVQQVSDRIVSLRAIRQQLTNQADAHAAAADAYRLTLDRYRAGLTNYLDVLINEERLLAERQRQVQLEGRSLSLVVEVFRALGGGYRMTESTTE